MLLVAVRAGVRWGWEGGRAVEQFGWQRKSGKMMQCVIFGAEILFEKDRTLHHSRPDMMLNLLWRLSADTIKAPCIISPVTVN